MTVTMPVEPDLTLLEPLLASHRGRPGALIPVLQAAQELYGYLSPTVLEAVAAGLRLSLGQVYGVATFYAQFSLQRRGRHLVRLCDGTACHVKGTPLLLTALEEGFHVRPGETSADGELTVEVVYCMGSCALAPVVVVDGAVMGRMRQDRLTRQVRRQMRAKSLFEKRTQSR